MDEDMSDIVDEGFSSSVRIDFDYEFEASRFFDFCQEESPLEAREAEGWFDTAETYPPSLCIQYSGCIFLDEALISHYLTFTFILISSAFVAKLNLEGSTCMENVNISPKTKGAENIDLSCIPSDTCMSTEHSVPEDEARGIYVFYYYCEVQNFRMLSLMFLHLFLGQEGTGRGDVNVPTNNTQNGPSEPHSLMKGLTFYNHMAQDIPKVKTKYATKPSMARGSTLMKPTESQLAKQNPARKVHSFSSNLERLQKPFLQTNERILENIPIVESQAAKRQKLDGGHLFKVPDMKHQPNLIHKAPKKNPVDNILAHSKLKLTVPREPDLETAHRAQRIRSKNNNESEKCVKSNTSMFRARPLNRKILDAPSLPLSKKSTPRLPEFQVFHLKTSERAMQHSSAASSSTLPYNQSDKVLNRTKAGSVPQNCDTDSKRSNPVDVPKHEVYETMHKFKARPLNKKIFSSKGDIGVFRNSKREGTVPMEFNFSTDKRNQCNPPVDLFNKMSLASELQQNNELQPKLLRHAYVHKGSKENTAVSFQQEHRITNEIQDKSQGFGGKQVQCGINGEITEIGSRANMSRSMGIR
ncbi:hypothetical protein GIB67_019016 [Kingdonia uniflora]|uniref:TPX2 central domain-containing protein n=1 Tax=Kingdonia uniflora TaxID=39325 RepID=A0A7J7MZI0_9MAGN|nr:hypothetical protein GIB67_019016 [Kingdonia uniflora]